MFPTEISLPVMDGFSLEIQMEWKRIHGVSRDLIESLSKSSPPLTAATPPYPT